MSATIKIKTVNLDNVHKALNNLGDKIANPDEKLLRRLGDAGINDISQRFQTRGYNTWQELSPETKKRKGNDFILIDSGAMFYSKTMQMLQPGIVVVKVPFGGKAHNPDVPIYHQIGTSRMPQRKIIAVTPQLTSNLTKTLATWVKDMILAFRKEM